jgi:hypothetical protein
MTESRRRWLTAFVAALGALASKPLLSAPQLPRPSRDPRPYPNGRNPGQSPSDDPSTPEGKAAVFERQKQIQADVARLYEMATDLKSEVEKGDANATLSVSLIRKAQEIEKLAKQIKNLAKGSS